MPRGPCLLPLATIALALVGALPGPCRAAMMLPGGGPATSDSRVPAAELSPLHLPYANWIAWIAQTEPRQELGLPLRLSSREYDHPFRSSLTTISWREPGVTEPVSGPRPQSVTRGRFHVADAELAGPFNGIKWDPLTGTLTLAIAGSTQASDGILGNPGSDTRSGGPLGFTLYMTANSTAPRESTDPTPPSFGGRYAGKLASGSTDQVAWSLVHDAPGLPRAPSESTDDLAGPGQFRMDTEQPLALTVIDADRDGTLSVGDLLDLDFSIRLLSSPSNEVVGRLKLAGRLIVTKEIAGPAVDGFTHRLRTIVDESPCAGAGLCFALNAKDPGSLSTAGSPRGFSGGQGDHRQYGGPAAFQSFGGGSSLPFGGGAAIGSRSGSGAMGSGGGGGFASGRSGPALPTGGGGTGGGGTGGGGTPPQTVHTCEPASLLVWLGAMLMLLKAKLRRAITFVSGTRNRRLNFG